MEQVNGRTHRSGQILNESHQGASAEPDSEPSRTAAPTLTDLETERPSNHPWNERLMHANLACRLANFYRAGTRHLVLCRVLEARRHPRHIAAAVPGARIVVVRLHAPLELLHARIGSREVGDPGWYVDTATGLIDRLETAGVQDTQSTTTALGHRGGS